MNSLDDQIKKFLPPHNRYSLLLDTSAGLVLGALPGLEDFGASVSSVLSCLDGLVCSPGQLRRLGSTGADTALLARMDWTNTLRDSSFLLPPESTTHIFILDPKEAFELGAAGMVISFLLGYEEAIEAACLKAAVQLSLAGKDIGLPLVVEVRPNGPRVSLPAKAIELGASYALESGVDVIVVPYPGLDSLNTISVMVSVPWLLKPTSIEKTASEWEEALGLGASGLWLDHTWLRHAAPLLQISDRLHQLPERAK